MKSWNSVPPTVSNWKRTSFRPVSSLPRDTCSIVHGGMPGPFTSDRWGVIQYRA